MSEEPWFGLEQEFFISKQEIFKNKLVCLFFLAIDKNLETPFDKGPKKIL